MKKIFVLLTMTVASFTAAYALEPSEEYNAFFKLNNEATFNCLMNYIEADQAQANYLQHIFKVTENELRTAINKDNENAVENTLSYNFRNTKTILTETQYKRYLEFVNVYLINGYDFKMLSKK